MNFAEVIPLFAMLGISGGEWIIIAVVFLVLFGATRIPPFMMGLKRGAKEFRRASKDVNDGITPPPTIWPVADALTHTNQTVECDPPPEPTADNSFVVWFAQGFGIGRLKPAPGTWGTLLGLAWFAALVVIGSLPAFLAGILISVPVCAWACGEAEMALEIGRAHV